MLLVPAVFGGVLGSPLGSRALVHSVGALAAAPSSLDYPALAHRPALPYGSGVAVSNRCGNTAIPLALPGLLSI